ncbi:hypothetical protein AAFO92_21225 [Roseovarius sp. CAU 1744]|uniref:hypothetical protein n=1 Tax=Roseovarius sp. CAU 1744 TaxID=3140368 RepID=UPI00325A4A08
MWRLYATAGLLVLLVPLFVMAQDAPVPLHRAGFDTYARVTRSDGTWRDILIRPEDRRRFASSGTFATGTILMMESFRSSGALGAVFLAEKKVEGWRYASLPAGGTLDDARPAHSCSACHRLSTSGSPVFTLPLLRRNLTDADVQFVHCPRSGRAPCRPEVYD